MNVDLLNNLQKKIMSLEENINDINKKISSILIDNQSFVKKNTNSRSSIGYKIYYDINGLIIKSEDLTEMDIPTLSIDKIKGLRRELNKKIDKSEINNMLNREDRELVKSDIIGTGCKVNYDKNGLIVSTSNLLQEDIPILSIDKIDKLSDELSYIKSLIKNNTNESKNDTNNIIEVNKKKEKLTENDIPISIITRINNLDAKLTNFASKESVDNLFKLLDNKSSNDTNNELTPISRRKEITKNTDIDLINNRLNSLELTMQKILNQFNKISEILKFNKKLESIENKLNNLENKNKK